MGITLDSIDLKISSDASKAAKSLEELKASLSGLNSALAPTTSGLESMVVSLSKLVGLQTGLADIAKTFGNLARSWTALNTSTNKSAAEMAGITDKARTMAQAFAKEYGIKGKQSVTELTNAFQRLYNSVGDNVALGKELHNIEMLIRKYAELKGEVTDAGRVMKEVLQNSTVKLPSSITKELSSNLINSMSKLSHVSATHGALPSEIVKEINAALDPNRVLGGNKDYSAGFINIEGMTNEAQILEKLVAALRAAEGQTMTFSQAAAQNNDVVNMLNEKLERLASSVGTTMSGSMQAYMDAMTQINAIAPTLVDQFMRVDTAIDNIAANGNPFDTVLGGLTQLADINLSASLNNITAIKDAVGRLGGETGTRAATVLPSIATALRQMDGVTVPPIGADLINLAAALSKLGGKKVGDAFINLENMKASLMAINTLKIDPAVTQSIHNLADALYKFGLAKIDKAVSTIPALAGSITQLINSLSSMPTVSENTIRLISALGNIGNVNVNANNLGSALGGRLSNGLRLYTNNAINAKNASMLLAQAFGKMYANYFLFFRIARRIKKNIDLASDLKETQNVVDVTFGEMANRMNEFADTAIETLGMSELTAKKIASRYQAMGSAMDISDSMVKSTNDFVQSATKGYADVADSIADVSINLTRLAGDMASFYNVKYTDVAEDLEAIYTGMSKPLRKFGIDLSQATISQWALNRGMQVNFKTMTQAEKTLLRYQYVMAQTTAAHGDFQRTQKSWANQTRIATERLNQLRVVLGKIAIYTFKPLVMGFNKAVTQIIKGAEGLLNALGKIFGWQIEWNGGAVLDDEADDSEELADNMGDAADNAKKFKNFLLGIDELNILPSDDDKDKGTSGALGELGELEDDLGSFTLKPMEKGFESLYDTLFKLGARINDLIKKLIEDINWDTVYKKARNFGTGLADFLNGLLNDSQAFYDIGKFFAGGVNAVAHAIDAFHKRFDGWQWGVDIGSAINGFMENLDWDVIQSAAVEKAHDIAQTINAAFMTINWKLLGKTIAEGLNTAIDYFYTLGKEIEWSAVGASIASGINSLFENFDFAQAAETLNYWVKGLLDALIALLDKTDWQQVGESIGEFIKEIDFISIATKIVTAFWKALDGVFSAYGGMLSTVPIETAITSTVILAFSSKRLRLGIVRGVRKYATAIGTDITRIFMNTSGNNSLINTFMSGFIGADSRGIITSAGSVFGNIKNGVNAVSDSLSTATKAVGGLAVGFGEFFTVKNLVGDIAEAIAGNGEKDLAGSITKLIGVVGLATTAFAFLLGIPTGLIIAGATAAVAAIVGISEAMQKLDEETVISNITKDMGEAYISIGELVESYKTFTDTIGGDLDNLSRQYTDVKELNDQLNNLVDGYGLVVTAINGGNQLTSSAMKELIGNIESVKSAWEDYIQAQYDYLIQATINDYQFEKAQGQITKERENYYTERIQQLTSAREDEVEELNKLIEALEDSNNYYAEVVEQGASASAIKVAETDLAEKTQALLEFGSATGALKSDDLKEFNKSLKELSEMHVDFSNIDVSSYDELAAAAKGYYAQVSESYKQTLDRIEQTKEEYMERGMTEEQAMMQLQPRIDALNKASSTIYEKIQNGMYDVFYQVLEDNDRHRAYLFAEKFIDPVFDEIPTVIDEKGNEVKPWVRDAVYNMLDDATGDTDTWDWSGIFPKLRKDWQAQFYQLAPESYDTGKKISEMFASGVSDGAEEISSTNFKLVPEDLKNTAKESVKDIEKMGDVSGNSSKYISVLLQSIDDYTDSTKEASKGTELLNRMMDNFGKNTGGGHDLQAMASLQSQAGLAFSNISLVKEQLEETVNAGKGVEDISNNFGALGGVFTNVLTAFEPVKTGFENFNTETQANMQKTTTVFGESFSGIMKYGNQTLSWLKGSFVPYFSGAYWSSITSSIPNAFGNAFRQAINIMMNLWKQFATWANQNMKMKVNMRGKEVTGVDVEIPQYATGGFPEDGLFQANHGEMVGQFANGKTAVANNEQIVEGIRQGVYDAVRSAMSESGSGNVTVELAGDASDIFTAVVKENNRTIYRTGTSPLRN